jgi:hypothetical protein
MSTIAPADACGKPYVLAIAAAPLENGLVLARSRARPALAVGLALFGMASAGCGYVSLNKTSLPSVKPPTVQASVPPAAQFVSAATVNAVTSGSYVVTSELGISTGSLLAVTKSGYTVWQSSQGPTSKGTN